MNLTRGPGPNPESANFDEEIPRRPSPGQTLGIRLLALTEVILAAFAGSLFAPMLLGPFGVSPGEALSNSRVLGLLLFADATCTIVFLWGMQRFRGRKLRSLGWSRWGRVREFRLGLQVFLGLILLMFLLSALIQAVLPGWVTAENRILVLLETPTDLAIFLAASLYAGGIKEELQRAFILTRFEEHLGGALPGLVLWSAVFGSLHYTQGADNAVKAGFLGLILGLLYWKRQRLEAPIVAHTLFDVLVVFLVYFFPQLAGSR